MKGSFIKITERPRDRKIRVQATGSYSELSVLIEHAIIAIADDIEADATDMAFEIAVAVLAKKFSEKREVKNNEHQQHCVD